jgi:xylose isomerase
MMAEVFKGIKKIKYEGPDSKNPLAFKYYNAKEKIGKKTMEEHMRFSVAYWHSFKGGGTDPFGPNPVYDRPWDRASDPMQRAEDTLHAAFEFIGKLGAPFYCWHDRDIAPEADNLRETNKRKKSSATRASSSYGGLPIAFHMNASPMAPAPTPMPMSLHGPPRRSKRRWSALTN